MYTDGPIPLAEKDRSVDRKEGLKEIFQTSMAGLLAIKDQLPPEMRDHFEWNIINATQAHESLIKEYANNK